jgi:sporulation-control protein
MFLHLLILRKPRSCSLKNRDEKDIEPYNELLNNEEVGTLILRKYLSLLGIGSAQIDLILPKETYKPGDSVQGYFLIKGGTIEQQIKQIDCDLVLMDKRKRKEKVIDTKTILLTTRINSEESNKVEFTFQLPSSVPVSTAEISYRLKTKLTFTKGVESFDQDVIRIIE